MRGEGGGRGWREGDKGEWSWGGGQGEGEASDIFEDNVPFPEGQGTIFFLLQSFTRLFPHSLRNGVSS